MLGLHWGAKMNKRLVICSLVALGIGFVLGIIYERPKPTDRSLDSSLLFTLWSRHALGIQSDGSLWAWGGNDDGQLGNSTTLGSKVPVRVGVDCD